MIDNKFKTNKERAAALGLRSAPTLKGYLLDRDIAEKIITHNKKIATGKAEWMQIGIVYIETTRRCNLKCPFCYTDALARKSATPELNLAEMKKGIQAARQRGARTMAIAGAGEPFLDKNLFGILEFALANGMEVVLFTNGTLMTKETAKELRELDITVVAKIPAITPMIQDEVVGVKNAHRKMMNGFFMLLDAGLRTPKLGAEAVITRQNANEMEQLLRYARYVNVVPFLETLEPLGRGCAVIETLALTREEYAELFHRLREIDEKEHETTWVILDGTRVVAHEVDYKKLYGIRIGVNGDVMLFANEDNVLGNMRQMDIERILDKPEALIRLYKREFNLEMGDSYAD